MKYRCQEDSAEGVVIMIAASYLRNGSYGYVTGSIPPTKDAETVDRKLVTKYGLGISQWARSSRRKRGLANAQYLRYGRWFILMLTEAHHALRLPTAQGGEREQLKDCRRQPIQFAGYSISYRRSDVASVSDEPHKWRAHVRIDAKTYAALKAHFESIAVHRSCDNLAQEFAAIPYARYAPIRRHLLNLLRLVNQRRKQHNFEPLPDQVLNLLRSHVKVYADASQTTCQSKAE